MTFITILLLILGIGIFYICLSYIFAFVLSSIQAKSQTKVSSYKDGAFEYGPIRPSWVPEKAFLLNLHAHTNFTDGELDAKQLVLWSKIVVRTAGNVATEIDGAAYRSTGSYGASSKEIES